MKKLNKTHTTFETEEDAKRWLGDLMTDLMETCDDYLDKLDDTELEVISSVIEKMPFILDLKDILEEEKDA